VRNSRRSFLKSAAAVSAGGLVPKVAFSSDPSDRVNEADFQMPRGMTLLTFRSHGEYRLGVKTAKGILDVKRTASELNLPAPTSMDDLLQNGKGGILKRLVEAAGRKTDTSFTLPEQGLEYGPVLMNPEKILMLGLNYRQHAIETHSPIPTNPVLFNKYNNSLNCHNGVIRLPSGVAHQFDYEVELVVIIGKTARDVPEDRALEYVAGYCTGNDFSARDLQSLTSQWMIGKTSDGFAPIGPYFVSADLIGDPNKLRLETRVNGEQRQDWNTQDMIFSCPQIISFISKIMTLKPGDILFTGTPHGVIMGKPKDQQVWLTAGDQIACSIEKLGELKFTLV
jgi:2-keto-4-pentenoate hydratase/2-oxohepta-3-ene-1,7-dioic acid hydratase in catechol pathway